MKDEFFADIEPLVGVLRVFHRGDKAGRDPYEFSATVVYHDDGKTVELKGVKTNDPVQFVRLRDAIFKAFWVRGVNTLIWDRRASDGQVRRIKIHLDSYFRRKA